jgi:hypothetical protein
MKHEIPVRCYGVAAIVERLQADAARALVQRSYGATGFFEWESEPEAIGAQVKS